MIRWKRLTSPNTQRDAIASPERSLTVLPGADDLRSVYGARMYGRGLATAPDLRNVGCNFALKLIGDYMLKEDIAIVVDGINSWDVEHCVVEAFERIKKDYIELAKQADNSHMPKCLCDSCGKIVDCDLNFKYGIRAISCKKHVSVSPRST